MVRRDRARRGRRLQRIAAHPRRRSRRGERGPRLAARRRPGARRRGDGGGDLPVAAPARAGDAAGRDHGAPGRAAVAHPAALPVQHAQHRAHARSPRSGQGRRRARRPGRAVSRRHRRERRVGLARRGSRPRPALPRHRADPLRQPPARHLGARPAGRVGAGAAAPAAAAGRERRAPRRRAVARGRRDPRQNQGQARPCRAVDRQQRAQGAVAARARHGAEECPRTSAPDARRRRAVRDAHRTRMCFEFRSWCRYEC